MPVWHVSLSIADQAPGHMSREQAHSAYRLAAWFLNGAGLPMEWWYVSSPANAMVRPGVAHLRVGLTPDEYSTCPTGSVVADAGFTGTYRRRRR